MKNADTKHHWVISVAGHRDLKFHGTEAQAEMVRAHKVRGTVATKRREE